MVEFNMIDFFPISSFKDIAERLIFGTNMDLKG